VQCIADILIQHERAITSFLTAPFRLKFALKARFVIFTSIICNRYALLRTGSDCVVLFIVQ